MSIDPATIKKLLGEAEADKAALDKLAGTHAELAQLLRWFPPELVAVREQFAGRLAELDVRIRGLRDRLLGPRDFRGVSPATAALAIVAELQDQRHRDVERIKVLREKVLALTRQNMELALRRVDEAPTFVESAFAKEEAAAPAASE